MADDAADQIVGRESERQALRAVARRAMSGDGTSVVVAGSSGIGKSALLDDLVTSPAAAGLAVARMVGSAAESQWPYSGLHQLFSVVAGALDPGDRSTTAVWAETAMRLAGGGDSSYEVALRVKSLVEDIPKPLLVVIDDAHLLDARSREVLGFVARRLGATPVALVLATRLSALDASPFSGLRTLHLTDLPEAARIQMLHASTGGRITADAAEALARTVGGNPCAMLDVVRRVPAEQLEGRAEFDPYLPASPLLAEMFLPDLDDMDEQQRRALLTAALVRDGLFAPLVDALGEQRDRVASWLAHRFLAVSDGVFRFRSPAVASVIWHSASPGEKATAHAALAETYASIDAELELWHRAQSHDGHDDVMADRLADAAGRARSRGEFDRSIALVRQSVRLAGSTADRARRLILSGQLAFHAGRLGDAVRIARERARLEATPAQRADLAYIEAAATYLSDGYVAAGLLTRHAEEVRDSDANRACRLYVLAATQFLERIEMSEAQRYLTLAERHLAGADDTTLAMYRTTCARMAAQSGDDEQASALLDAGLLSDVDEFDEGFRDVSRAVALLLVERYDEARTLLHAITRDRRHGDSPVLIAAANATLGVVELRVGRVVAARDAARQSARAMPGPWSRTTCVATTMINVHALLGEVDKAWDHATEALDHAQVTGQRLAAGWAHAGTGFLLLVHGRLDEAVPVLDRARGYALELADPSLIRTEPDLVEAYVRQGDVGRARDVLQEFEARARKSPSAWASATLARCRALVADGEAALALFVEAIDASGWPVSPIEQGRTVLAYGERLRRAGQKLEARRQFDRAAVLFRECGAAALASRAERELRSNGVAPLPRSSSTGELALTAAEARVASMAAAGMRNREIAAELYVSTRTIEGHLSQVFRKLGIRSRTELAGVLARMDGAPLGRAEARASEPFERPA